MRLTHEAQVMPSTGRASWAVRMSVDILPGSIPRGSRVTGRPYAARDGARPGADRFGPRSVGSGPPRRDGPRPRRGRPADLGRGARGATRGAVRTAGGPG